MLAVILAAGKGTRLLPLTETTPKALVDICGKPLIVRLMEALPDNVTEILIVVGHLKEKITDKIGNTWNGKPVTYVTQDPLDGTGTAIHLAKDRVLGKKFIVVNGDDLYAKRDLERLAMHELGILVQHNAEAVPASVLLDAQGCLEGLEMNPPKDEPHVRVCGAYTLDERFFNYPLAQVDVRGTTEYGLPHTLIQMTKDMCVKAEEATYWVPVGTPSELDRARLKCRDQK
jgi:bifunctional UDP-N-acetylglucosamine pyrophosphorylase/glucosamine-1-phosphate N-acetyltransferase